MYLDKIYTKLYSDKNWKGLAQLISEVQYFSKKSKDCDKGKCSKSKKEAPDFKKNEYKLNSKGDWELAGPKKK